MKNNEGLEKFAEITAWNQIDTLNKFILDLRQKFEDINDNLSAAENFLTTTKGVFYKNWRTPINSSSANTSKEDKTCDSSSSDDDSVTNAK